MSGGAQPSIELERLICAAVGNRHFAAQLLNAPEMALSAWQRRHPLSVEEKVLVASITGAADIYDFAARLYASVTRGHEYEDQFAAPPTSEIAAD
jgi:hypothetical protein